LLWGVCNGCQMFAHIAELIPGAEHWPTFTQNVSRQFEARLSSVLVGESPSILLQGMAGSRLPIAVAHGEGRALFGSEDDLAAVVDSQLVALQFVDSFGNVAVQYPANPNGSPLGVTGLCTPDGRVTVIMPHPERVFRAVQHSWCPEEWGEFGPWVRLFWNARDWLG